jgi:hypothetical protein
VECPSFAADQSGSAGCYGGTERIVAYLTDALVALGHDVTSCASGDTSTTARLEPAFPRALRLDPTIRDPIAPLIVTLERVARGCQVNST